MMSMISVDWNGSQGQRELHESKHKEMMVQGCQRKGGSSARDKYKRGLKRIWSWTEGLVLK